MGQAINNFSSNKYTVKFCGMPLIDSMEYKPYLFEEYISSVTIPDVTINVYGSNYPQIVQNHPHTEGNRDLQDLTITFIMNETCENFYYLYKIMLETRYGQTMSKKNIDGIPCVWKNIVDVIEVGFLDNKFFETSKLLFKNAILRQIGSLQLGFMDSKTVTFTTTWKYQYIDFEKNENYDGGVR